MEKYNNLLQEISLMISDKDKGYGVAREMNDEFWDELGTHRIRMEEQMGKITNLDGKPELRDELRNADSIYEAARTYIAKYK